MAIYNVIDDQVPPQTVGTFDAIESTPQVGWIIPVDGHQELWEVVSADHTPASEQLVVKPAMGVQAP